jgi:hypothetical protein
MDLQTFLAKWYARDKTLDTTEPTVTAFAATILEAIDDGITSVHHHYVLTEQHQVRATGNIMVIEPHPLYLAADGLMPIAAVEEKLGMPKGSLTIGEGLEVDDADYIDPAVQRKDDVGSTDLAVEALKHYAEQYCEGMCNHDNSQAVFHKDDCGGCAARRALLRMTHGAMLSVKPVSKPPFAKPFETDQANVTHMGVGGVPKDDGAV